MTPPCRTGLDPVSSMITIKTTAVTAWSVTPARVPVHRRGERPSGHRVLDEGEAVAGLVAVDHEPHPDASQEPRLAVAGTNDLRHRAPPPVDVVSEVNLTDGHA